MVEKRPEQSTEAFYRHQISFMAGTADLLPMEQAAREMAGSVQLTVKAHPGEPFAAEPNEIEDLEGKKVSRSDSPFRDGMVPEGKVLVTISCKSPKGEGFGLFLKKTGEQIAARNATEAAKAAKAKII